MPDGTLLCLGRLDGDTQIKLRGIRIELQEVESALASAANGLLSTIVVSRLGDGLIAHATLSPGKDITSEEELIEVLSRLKLPQAFIPATIIVLPTVPTTANGKLDRKAISAIALQQGNAASTVDREPMPKMTLREGELRLLWERVLPETAMIGRIGPSSDFFLYGGNSLLLMKLQAAIKESMGLSISTAVLYRSSTLRDMARCVEEQRDEQANGTEQEINWAAETSVPIQLLAQIRELPVSVKSRSLTEKEGIEVLMTGATSFLGGFLLRSLVQFAIVSKVHCVAVLADDQHKLYQDEKVKCYTGSLLSPTLGLNTAECKHLAETVHVIIHAGASGHCLNTYASLRTPNLLSTHFLASLALSRSVPLLFLSSNRVVLLSGTTAPPPCSVAAFPPATDGLEGYTASKWASEAFLENLVTQMQFATTPGLRPPWTVAVHRPCVVVSEKAPNSDALNAILRYSVLMRCVPRMKKVEGFLDFGQIEDVVDEITEAAIKLAQAESKPDGHDQDFVATIHFRHHSSKVKVPVSEFRSRMEAVYGGDFEEADVADWMSRAVQAGIDPLITSYLEGILDSGSAMVFPYLGEE